MIFHVVSTLGNTREIRDKFHFYAIHFLWERKSAMVLIYIYTYHISLNLYTPDSVSLASLARQLVMCSVSTNGERASLANLKLTIGSLLECSYSVKSLVDRLS